MKHLATVILAVLATAAPANAQDGVTVDPDSPAGTEYALPLEAARRDAAGGKPAPGQGRSAPLFGEGVGSTTGQPAGGSGGTPTGDDERPTGGSGGGTPRAGSDARTNAGARAYDDPGGTASAGGGRSTGTRHAPAVVRAEADGSWTDGATVAAMAAAVLVLGGVLGSILRRRTA